MKKGYTDITILLDRSGSILDCLEAMQDSLNEYLSGLKEQDGDVRVSAYQFDALYDANYKPTIYVDCLFTERPVKELSSRITIEPRGWTPLLDAMGRVITNTGARLASKPEDERPERVLFVTITDGLENTSQEFTRKSIKSMITHQTDKYNWNFVYLGANQDAFSVAEGLGISIGSTMTYNTSKAGLHNTIRSLNSYTASYAATGQAEFTEEDKNNALAD